jgi:hypothetical protein
LWSGFDFAVFESVESSVSGQLLLLSAEQGFCGSVICGVGGLGGFAIRLLASAKYEWVALAMVARVWSENLLTCIAWKRVRDKRT